jgi:DNA modification methylase
MTAHPPQDQTLAVDRAVSLLRTREEKELEEVTHVDRQSVSGGRPTATGETRLYRGDLFEVLPTLAAESIDALVTDPPYGIGFMGREWDTFKPGQVAQPERYEQGIESDNPNLRGRRRSPAISSSQIPYDYSLPGLRSFQEWTEAWAREVLRVLKPGGYAVVCGAPRAYHRMASGLEDAGFEIRDCFAWLFGSGFPKSLNLGEGLGTALKPAHEPIVLARKPFKGTVKGNVEKYGTGALNIDACRLETRDADMDEAKQGERGRTECGAPSTTTTSGELYPVRLCMRRDEQAVVHQASIGATGGGAQAHRREEAAEVIGRWPANVILDEIAAMVLDEQAPDVGGGNKDNRGQEHGFMEGRTSVRDDIWDRADERGGASRFYYVAKPSREERDMGCYDLSARSGGEATDRKDGSAGLNNPRAGAGRTGGGRNFHPTVKPVELMRWLVKLVTPIGGTVLDPFTGSGTTGMACRYEQREFIGIEREAEYIEIAERRIASVAPLFEAGFSNSDAVDPVGRVSEDRPRAGDLF